MSFDPNSYPAPVAALLTTAPDNPLGPGKPNAAARAALDALDAAALAGGRSIADEQMARACLAGLWLRHNFLDTAHTISQEIDTTTGSFWHGIMHRREPDYGNAKYWFRRVGRHPVFGTLNALARSLTGSRSEAGAQLAELSEWDPLLFVDLCQRAAAGEASLEPLCREVQQREWETLFDYCYRQAVKS